MVKEEGIEEGSFHFGESCRIAHGLVTAVCSVVWEGGVGVEGGLTVRATGRC